MNDVLTNYNEFHSRIIVLINTARDTTVRSINSVITATYWEISRHIVISEQNGQSRAVYGDFLIEKLAVDLTRQFGRGFSRQNLQKMRSFYLAWTPEKISLTVSSEFIDILTLAKSFPLSWSAYVRLLSVKNENARQFYEIESLRCGWSVRDLNRQIDGQFFERTALSKNKASMLKQAEKSSTDIITPEQALKDPFVLEFLNLKDEYSESDLEEALIKHLTDFLMELGDDFAFVSRQRRLRLDDNWFRIDLLFFHRQLKCLIVIDLKVGKFSYADEVKCICI